MANRISINWIGAHRRSDEIGALLGVQPYFVRSADRILPIRYVKQWRETQRILRQVSPEVVVVMQPPPFALAAVAAYARRHDTVVIGDLHSGVFFDPKWAWSSKWVLRTLKRFGSAVVPNADLREICAAAGVPVIVSHGRIQELSHAHDECATSILPPDEYVLAPLAWAYDEPIELMLHAARLTPDVTWVLTGRAQPQIIRAAPPNVVFPGFVSAEEYRTLRLHASAVFALTTEASTMQSAGYEAAAAATPLVTVAERVLVDYFGDAARYSGLTAEELAEAAVDVLANSGVWRERMEGLRSRVIAQQDEPGKQIQAWIEGRLERR